MDNNLLSGLESLGLGNLEGLDIYEDPHKDEKKQEEAAAPKEEDMLFDKSYTCTVCDKDFKVKMVRSGKAKAMAADQDLRPRYEGIDVLKYDVVSCPYCGYTGLSKYFSYLTPAQRKAIKENICSSYKPKKVDPDKKIYTYEDAMERHKLALVNAIVKHGKASESFPICGMDEMTVDYLLATLAMRFEEYETAAKLLGSIVTSRTANARIKDRAHDLKDVLMEKLKEKR